VYCPFILEPHLPLPRGGAVTLFYRQIVVKKNNIPVQKK
jgi:hypothetical protein